MSVTIKDIAKLAHVHHSTVVRALKEKPSGKISEAVVDKIRAIAKETGYKKNVRASMFQRNVKDIGIFIGLEEDHLVLNPMYQQIVAHLLSQAAKTGKRLVYCQSPPPDSLPEEKPEIIDESLYRGIVLLGGYYPAYLDDMAARIPVLQLFRTKPSSNMYQLKIDNNQAAKLILDYFVSLKIKKPILIYFQEDQIFKDRIESIIRLNANGNYGLKINKKKLPMDIGALICNKEFQDELKELFIQHDACLAFSASGYVYVNLLHKHLEPSRDYRFIIYDNIPTYRRLFPGINVVGIDYSKMAERILSFFDSKDKAKINYVDLEIIEDNGRIL
jgi:DNA-binding LacI/PurR family transcriptional regulator